ncbi:hypothetical protein V5O48_017963 [Marasmius crinis-equi]|uniref:Cytochrome P450 n=1 Tax=Marasmius crinis-equi TaxID=585013 RepID=A0ABR3EMI2_9AGAR
MTTPIPQPRGIPFLGNIASIDRDLPINGFTLLAKQYGEIYKLNILGQTTVFLNSHRLVNEVSDESRFKKVLNPGLAEVRHLVGDGLFTARLEEANWGIAHRVLMPAFGTQAVREMLEDMRDICSQLLLKWERFGPEHVIDPADDYTRVALDTIALCTMSYRMNSFYGEQPPQFARAMVDALKECFQRTQRPTVVQALMSGTNAKFQEDIRLMQELAHSILKHRQENPVEKKDLLNSMLFGKDPKTGEGLSDDSIANNLLTFLIAGHETSSGMMSFMTYYLIKNPQTMRKLQAEIDEVVGGEPIQYQDLSKMPYLTAVMRESLRLAPTASGRAVTALEDTTLANGKYAVKAGTTLSVITWVMQRDLAVWGDDANEFRPERMMDGKFEALPPNAWQPFGFGMRGCIGRPFAWQEVALVVASVVQKFNLEFVDPSYNLEIKQAMTVKPKDLLIKAKLRSTGPVLRRPLKAPGTAASTSTTAIPPAQASDGTGDKRIPMYILYGSNTGTSEAFAQRVANDAAKYGFAAHLGTMDSFTGSLATDGPVIVFTASYEGQPADNASRFVDWLQSLPDTSSQLKGVKYAVFGSGNSDWVATYHRIPKLCDEIIEKRGGTRLVQRGEGDSGKAEFFEVFDEFVEGLWQQLAKASFQLYLSLFRAIPDNDLHLRQEYQTQMQATPAESGFKVKIVDAGTARAEALRQAGTGLGKVIENRILTKPGYGEKRHIELELPKGVTYRAGDYIAILPRNPPDSVRRILTFFGLSDEQHLFESHPQIVISSSTLTSLPQDRHILLHEVLSGYVELSQPATTQDLRNLLDVASSESAKAYLQNLLSAYQTKVLRQHLTVLDILEAHPQDIKLLLGEFLRMLPPMRIRQYSISSSPLWNAERVTLTISVLEATSSGDGTKKFLGVASNYLARLAPGDLIQMSIRPSAASFHPPEDPNVPIVAFCAGSGLAPIRGFIQERAMQKASGRTVGKVLLFFGCRSPNVDYLYAETDLAEWVKLGVVDVRPAFSRDSDKSEGCKYVQDREYHDKEDVKQMFKAGAQFYICGSGQVARGVKARSVEVVQSAHENMNGTAAAAHFEEVMKGRYNTDVFD